jgi:putative component of membrane protein insertase Oxa1/YidC/SpoIIIJ protein YidD
MIRPMGEINVRRIPALVAGVLLFLGTGTCAFGDMALAVDLFSEGQWRGSLRECLRAGTGSDAEQARLLGAVCRIRLGETGTNVWETLGELSTAAADAKTQSMAAYELGRLAWTQGRLDEAKAALNRAFLAAPDHELFRRAGWSLDVLLREHPELEPEGTALRMQLRSSRDLWIGPMYWSCRPQREQKAGLLSRPGAWIVAFYRSQIGPAIGSRCSLEPSCSEYFLRASRKHGLLGVALIGDRLVREPGVVSRGEHPVPVPGAMHYADPLEAHDGWMEN